MDAIRNQLRNELSSQTKYPMFATVSNGQSYDGVLIKYDDESFVLESEVVISKKRTIIATKLSRLTSWDDMNYSFGCFGVDDISFLEFKDGGAFSRQCIVKLKTEFVAERVVAGKYIPVWRRGPKNAISVIKYCPWRIKEKRENGKYRILCSNFKNTKMAKMTEEELIRYLERLLYDYDYTGFQLLKDNYQFKGEVLIRFKSKMHKINATRQLRKEEKLTVKDKKTNQLLRPEEKEKEEKGKGKNKRKAEDDSNRS